jgi:hypothetical protein
LVAVLYLANKITDSARKRRSEEEAARKATEQRTVLKNCKLPPLARPQ